MDTGRERPFLDSNVIFSGLGGSGSPPATILDLHADGRLLIVVSRYVLEEVTDALRRKQPALLPSLEALLVTTPPELVADPTLAEIEAAERCINPKDAEILAAAVKSGAGCLVSGNTRHFTPAAAECAGIPILTPAAYLATVVL